MLPNPHHRPTLPATSPTASLELVPVWAGDGAIGRYFHLYNVVLDRHRVVKLDVTGKKGVQAFHKVVGNISLGFSFG